jgi:predicted transcriptional regulator
MQSDVKTAARSIIDSLPDDVTWEDVQYHLYVRQQIDVGLADEAAGRLIDTDQLRRRLEELKSNRAKGVS